MVPGQGRRGVTGAEYEYGDERIGGTPVFFFLFFIGFPVGRAGRSRLRGRGRKSGARGRGAAGGGHIAKDTTTWTNGGRAKRRVRRRAGAAEDKKKEEPMKTKTNKTVEGAKRARVALLTGERAYMSAPLQKKDGFTSDDARAVTGAFAGAKDEDDFFFACLEASRAVGADDPGEGTKAVSARIATSKLNGFGVVDFVSGAAKKILKKGLVVVVNAVGADLDAIVPSRRLEGAARAEKWRDGSAIWFVDGAVADGSPIWTDEPDDMPDDETEVAATFTWLELFTDGDAARGCRYYNVLNAGAKNARVKIRDVSCAKKAFVTKKPNRRPGGPDVTATVYSVDGRLWTVRETDEDAGAPVDVALWTRRTLREGLPSDSYGNRKERETEYRLWLKSKTDDSFKTKRSKRGQSRETAESNATRKIEDKVFFAVRKGERTVFAASDEGRPAYETTRSRTNLAWIEDGSEEPTEIGNVVVFEADEKDVMLEWMAENGACKGSLEATRRIEIEVLDQASLDERRVLQQEVAQAIEAGMPKAFASDVAICMTLVSRAPRGSKPAAWAATLGDFERIWASRGGDPAEAFAVVADPWRCVALPNGGGAVLYEETDAEVDGAGGGKAPLRRAETKKRRYFT